MDYKFILSAKAKILLWDRQDFHQLAQSMTYNELYAMRDVLLKKHYSITQYSFSQPDYKEQIVYHYIMYLLYEAEYSDCVDGDVRKLYDLLFFL